MTPVNRDVRSEVRSFSLYQKERGDLHPFLALMRTHVPVSWSDELGGYWIVTDYAAVVSMLRDTETFSSNKRRVPADDAVTDRQAALRMTDPPEHTLWRKMFNPLFSPSAMMAIEGKIRLLIRGLLKSFIAQGGGDFVADVAALFPARVFLPLLGLPLEQLDRLLLLHQKLFLVQHSGPSADGSREAETIHAYDELKAEVDQILTERAALVAPPDDVITGLLNARVGERRLTRDEVVAAIQLLFGAGLDTVKNSLAMTVYHLATNPALRAQLRADPKLIPSAVEEYLRFFSPVTTSRKVARDITVAGQSLKVGDMVLLVTPSADRDPCVFSDPETINIERMPNRHIAFGAGPHRCLGSHLARIELRVALEEICTLMPEFELAPEKQVQLHYGLVFGCDKLDLRIL